MYAAVSSGPFDDDEEHYQGRGVLQAVESVDHILAEVLLGKDPTQQAKIDKLLAQESSLPANVVVAASIACCKAAAAQTLVSVFDHVGTMCNNSEGGIPVTAFSTINGGPLSASSLWVQVRKQDTHRSYGIFCFRQQQSTRRSAPRRYLQPRQKVYVEVTLCCPVPYIGDRVYHPYLFD